MTFCTQRCKTYIIKSTNRFFTDTKHLLGSTQGGQDQNHPSGPVWSYSNQHTAPMQLSQPGPSHFRPASVMPLTIGLQCGSATSLECYQTIGSSTWSLECYQKVVLWQLPPPPKKKKIWHESTLVVFVSEQGGNTAQNFPQWIFDTHRLLQFFVQRGGGPCCPISPW